MNPDPLEVISWHDEPPARRPLAVPLTLLITVAVGIAVVALLLSRMR